MTRHKEGPEKPFNDVMEHMRNVEGYPISKGGKLPLPIKVLGIILFGTFILMMVGGFVVNIIFN
ncbi:hypothetical protein CEY16_13540 [Halalkalibacillus sediminis]|uniref:Amino acid transporter n=1 Tax=Halalkalibacillus sediminis TaxID=2018042 RepID=A0A2I0QRM0_9BACI|nr:hypothetical protein [Halalkalibacillus sediminis]PKR76987.1 hypothetical protein CEY16_13540 [Halalkalibacillus sediminis]